MLKVTRLVNYGYDCQGWTEAAKRELASELETLVQRYVDRNGKTPEVEVNGTYGGVRIRKLTWLTEEQIDKLTIEADAIVDKIDKKTSYPVILDKVGIPEVTGYDD